MPRKVPTNVGWFPNSRVALNYGSQHFSRGRFQFGFGVFLGFKNGKFGFSFGF